MARTLLGALTNGARTLANKTPVPFTSTTARSSFGLGLARPHGQEAQMRAMGSNSTLYSIVDRIITAYAEVEWHLYRKSPSGQPGDRIEVTSHAALDLWNSPNPFMSGGAFRESGQQHEELTGEQWWVISKHPMANLPLELWPVRPDRMEPVPDANDFTVGYIYRGPSGEIVPLGLDDVLFLRRPNPIDPYRGMGVVQTLLIDLDATRASAEWNAAFFRNSAQPGGVVEVDHRLDDGEFNEFRTRWAEQHRGVNNAHRVAVLENGLKWVDRRYTMQEMQFTELRGISREIIREAFGFPKPMMGATDDVNRANAEAAEVVFARWLITPRLKRVRQLLNTRLLPMYGATAKGLEFDFDNPVPDDRDADSNELTARANAVKALVEAGAYGPSAREALGLPEIQFGAPGADADRELLIDLVKAAPAALSATILPMLGFTVPPPPAPAAPEAKFEDLATNLLGGPPAEGDLENAMRWEAVATIDDDTCQPCADNDGKTYRNRKDAYADYPGGSGYKDCVGAEFGNECRCRVVKRRKTGDDE